jgi:hypothetical protein
MKFEDLDEIFSKILRRRGGDSGAGLLMANFHSAILLHKERPEKTVISMPVRKNPTGLGIIPHSVCKKRGVYYLQEK